MLDAIEDLTTRGIMHDLQAKPRSVIHAAVRDQIADHAAMFL